MWKNWINGILGLWLIISPFVGMTLAGMTTNLVIVGIVVAVLSFVGLYQTDYQRQTHQHA